jgi:hypothetical protein
MSTRFIALLVAGAALSGCCASGTGCYAPTNGTPIAWDGLGDAPTANGELGSENRPKRRTARNREIVVGPLSESPARSEEGREADAKLARRIKICRDCGL